MLSVRAPDTEQPLRIEGVGKRYARAQTISTHSHLQKTEERHAYPFTG